MYKDSQSASCQLIFLISLFHCGPKTSKSKIYVYKCCLYIISKHGQNMRNISRVAVETVILTVSGAVDYEEVYV